MLSDTQIHCIYLLYLKIKNRYYIINLMTITLNDNLGKTIYRSNQTKLSLINHKKIYLR